MKVILKIINSTKMCFKCIIDKILRRDTFEYTPIHLMKSEIEIETLLEDDEELPQTRFITPPTTPKTSMIEMNVINSIGDVKSFHMDDNLMTESELFFSCEEGSDEDERLFNVDESDFFHNTRDL